MRLRVGTSIFLGTLWFAFVTYIFHICIDSISILSTGGQDTPWNTLFTEREKVH